MNIPNINLGPQDAQLGVTMAIPAAGANATTAILDLSTVAPNSNAWRLGRFRIQFPNLPGNIVAGGITVTMQVANPSLTNSGIAPQPVVPGAFAAPPTSQVSTLAGVAGTGTPAQPLYQTLALDQTGSVYEFYQFVVATTAGIAINGEQVSIVFELA